MISVIIVDYKTAERCVKYINDFCRTSDYKDVSFVVVDNTPNEENGNVISENLLESGFARSENYNLNDMKFKHIRTFNRNGISIVYLCQLLLLYVGVDISSFSHTVRWGYRIYASNVPQMVGVFWCLVTLMKTNTDEERKNTIGWLILFIFEVIFINQSRMVILCTALTAGIIILFSPSVKNKFWIIFVAVVVGLFALSTSTVQGIIIDSISESESTEGGNIIYRTYEKNYFENLLEGHELFGVGTPNQNYGQAAIYNGKQQSGFARDNFYMSGYYTSDLGIFAIRYYWGIVGLAIYEIISIAVLLYQIKEVVLCKRYEYELIVPMGINIFGFAASSTLCYYITRPGLYFVFLILQGIYIAERRREKQNENSMCRNMV